MVSIFLNKPQPNFFIVGAAKAGTTSLWMYLKQHPEIYMPPTIETKEPSFFCHLYGYKDFDSYLSLFSNAKGKKAIGEASTPYLSSPESAAWIQQVFPEAKIIIVLRNPVERAYSLYTWMIREGYEWIYPFKKALIYEEIRLKNEHFKYCNSQYYYNYLYFHSGLYSIQVKRYTEFFQKNQVHIILFEDLKSDPLNTIQSVYDFLNVDISFMPKIEIHNKGQTPLLVPLQYFLKQKSYNYLKKIKIPGAKQIQTKAMDVNKYLGQFLSMSLSSKIKNELKELYRKDIYKTAILINRKLDQWIE